MYEVIKPFLLEDTFNRITRIMFMKHVINTRVNVNITLRHRGAIIEVINNHEEKMITSKLMRGEKSHYLSIVDGEASLDRHVSKKRHEDNIINGLRCNTYTSNGSLVMNVIGDIIDGKTTSILFKGRDDTDYHLISKLTIREDRVTLQCNQGDYTVILSDKVILTHDNHGIKTSHQLIDKEDLHKVNIPKHRNFIIEIERLIENASRDR